MTRPKFKTDKTVVARLFHPKVLEEARKAIKAIDSKSPYPPPKKKSRNIGKA